MERHSAGDAVYYTAAVKIGDSYLVKSHSSLASFSADGELTETKTYQDGDKTYHIYDMLYHDGRVFLSAQKSIIFDADATMPLAIEMAYAKEWMEAGVQPPFSGEKQELYTNYFRSIFESALLVCDEDGVIHKVFTVPASRVTGRLETDANGILSWHVLRLDEATPPDPNLSVLCIFGVVTEFDMTFDPNGRLLEKREVGTYTRQIILN